jgi:hypothetical protein
VQLILFVNSIFPTLFRWTSSRTEISTTNFQQGRLLVAFMPARPNRFTAMSRYLAAIPPGFYLGTMFSRKIDAKLNEQNINKYFDMLNKGANLDLS